MKYTRDEAIKQIHKNIQKYPDITADEWDDMSLQPSRSTIRRIFPDNGWASIMEVCGQTRKPSEATGKEEFKTDYKDNSGIISSKSTRIRTMEQALKEADVDMNIWEVERCVINKWEVGAKDATSKIVVEPLFQVKIWLKRKVNLIDNSIKLLIEELKTVAPVVPEIIRPVLPANEPRYMYEICIFDLHMAMLAWDQETGHDYDMSIAEELCRNAIEDLLFKAKGFPIEQILLPTGNDLFHIDNMRNTTEASGNVLDVDSRWQRSFRHVHQLMTHIIDRLTLVAPVVVPLIPGNHDEQRTFYLGEVLAAYYANNDNVRIDNAPGSRKYYNYGTTLLGFTHGCRMKLDSLPLIMARERKEDWANCTTYEWHIGHVHKIREVKYIAGDTTNGVVVRTIPSLTSPDAWHHQKGFIGNRRSLEAYLWEYHDGYAGHFASLVKEI